MHNYSVHRHIYIYGSIALLVFFFFFSFTGILVKKGMLDWCHVTNNLE